MQRAIVAAACASALLASLAGAAAKDPVAWSAAARDRSTGAVTITLRAGIERGWYIYAAEQPSDGPMPLRFRVNGVTLTSAQVGAPQARTSFDRGFRARVAKHFGSPVFTLPVRFAGDPQQLTVEVRWQACNDDICLPPTTREFEVPIGSSSAGDQ